MITIPSPINGTVYCLDDFLADQIIIGVRSFERNKEVLSVTRVGQGVFYHEQDVEELFKKIVDDAMIEHAVYWNSKLWC